MAHRLVGTLVGDLLTPPMMGCGRERERERERQEGGESITRARSRGIPTSVDKLSSFSVHPRPDTLNKIKYSDLQIV